MNSFCLFGPRRLTRAAATGQNTRGQRPRPRLEVEALEERMLLNNRFVVPAGLEDNLTKFASLKAAFAAPALSAGDVIQIEQGSSPGVLFNADIPDLKNLTIQGDPTVDTSALPLFALEAVTIDAAQQGFTLRNDRFNVETGTFTADADTTISNSLISDLLVNGPAIELNGTSAAVINNSEIFAGIAANQFNDIVLVNPAAGSHNVITDNTIDYQDGSHLTLLGYQGGAGITDLVAHNTFIHEGGFPPGEMVLVQGIQGLTLQGNTFSSGNVDERGIYVDASSQNIQILDNVISFPNSGGSKGILVQGANAGATTSVVIANNHIQTGSLGIGIAFIAGAPGSTLTAKVEGNDFHGNQDGVEIGLGNGGPVSGIDLGGGSQGSRGANDFRGYVPGVSFAVATGAQPAAGLVQAQMNLFSVADPQTVIDNAGSAEVVTTGALTGNAAYVQTLFLDFLHRAGDVTSLADAGGWVNQLNLGAPAPVVANAIGRSQEALAIQVDALYHRFLRRQADAGEVAGWVYHLRNGATVEWVTQQIAGSGEYLAQHHDDSFFVTSLYDKLLNRIPSQAEVAAWLAILPALGRSGVAQGFVNSAEYRANQAQEDYARLLHRPTKAAVAEVDGWVNAGLDDLTMAVAFASSAEFQVVG
jgi:hypothetical protein